MEWRHAVALSVLSSQAQPEIQTLSLDPRYAWDDSLSAIKPDGMPDLKPAQ